jgi:hypothetical protein
MVKIKAPLSIVLVVVLAGCAAGNRPLPVPIESMDIPARVPGRFLSLACAGDALIAVFSDRESTTLKMIQMPVGDHLPAEAPPASVIDRIDTTPPLSPSFGVHVLAVQNSMESILYPVRQGEEKTVLKLASKSLDASQWTFDVVEPAGDPVAILPGDKGSLSIFWAAGSLLSRSYPDGTAPMTLRSPFAMVDRASVFASTGFTAYDGISHSLLTFAGNDGSGMRAIAGAGPVHSSLLASDGRLAVLTWDAATRRLVLLEGQPGESSVSGTTVTLCDQTATVALLPVRGERSRYLFLFDEERRRGGGGRVQHDLSLIAPARVLGALGSRYRKTVLVSGDERIEGFAVLQARNSLYVFVNHGKLSLLRAGLGQ